MFLCDSEIFDLGDKVINPFDPKRVQSASYDVQLAPDLLIPSDNNFEISPIDLRVHDPKDYVDPYHMNESGYILFPGKSILGTTTETIKCPENLVISLVGKSSYARLFLVPQLCAGWIDPGFNGQITLEITNHGPWNILLYPGMSIAQVNFAKMSSIPTHLYGSKELGSHYQGQTGATASSGKRGI